MNWQWSRFNELSLDDLYQILQVRQAVFAVEQDCVYQDCDGADPECWHLIGWNQDKHSIDAYLRVVPAGIKYPEIAIGRVLTSEQARGKNYGYRLMREGIDRITAQWPGTDIRISAQAHLQKFYASQGFVTVSDPYDEDGIPHVEMLRSASD